MFIDPVNEKIERKCHSTELWALHLIIVGYEKYPQLCPWLQSAKYLFPAYFLYIQQVQA